MSLVDVLQDSQEVCAFQLDRDREAAKGRTVRETQQISSSQIKMCLVRVFIIFCLSVVFCCGVENEINQNPLLVVSRQIPFWITVKQT